MEAYDKIKTNVMDMNKGAMDTLKSIQKHAPEFKELYTQQEKYNAEFETQLAVIEEERKNYKKEKKTEKRVRIKGDKRSDEEDENVFETGGFGQKKEEKRINTEPLEKQKMDIVNQLIGMSDEIRRFSNNVEEKLQHAHRSAGAFEKKFGYKGMTVKQIDEHIDTTSYTDHMSQGSREGQRNKGLSTRIADTMSASQASLLPTLSDKSGRTGIPPRMPSKTKPKINFH